jgi:hypothetical protein
MAYHPVTPGIIAGNVFRTVVNITQANSGLIITPTWIDANTNWNGIKRLDVTILVDTGVTVTAADTSSYAFSVSDFNSQRHRVTIINRGNIFGKGGVGGIRSANGGCVRSNPGAGGSGTVGGPALRLRSPTILINSGVIGGGGGGGGGDGATQRTYSEPYTCILNTGCNFAGGCSCGGPCSGCRKADRGCSCGKNQTRCRQYNSNNYAATCYRSVTDWCPNSSGAPGGDGSGAAGSNGVAYSTGAGTGRANGIGLDGVGFVLTGQGSVLGVIRGGSV